MGEIGFALPGSVVVRHTRCGKAVCRCRAEPPQLHGPYIQWTRKVEGKTVTRYLTADQLERYQPWFDNARRLRELVAALEDLSVRTAEAAEGWLPKRTPAPEKRPETRPPTEMAVFCDSLLSRQTPG